MNYLRYICSWNLEGVYHTWITWDIFVVEILELLLLCCGTLQYSSVYMLISFTLCMLNYFWGNRDNILIFYHLSTWMTQVINKTFGMDRESKDLSILQSQYYGCWWPGNPRSQGISSNGVDLVLVYWVPSILINFRLRCCRCPIRWSWQLNQFMLSFNSYWPRSYLIFYTCYEHENFAMMFV